MTKKPSKASTPAKRGRPPAEPEMKKRETFQFRVPESQQAPWIDSANAMEQDKSEWARDGLDAWTLVCTRAAELSVDPDDLIKTALEDHARVRAAVAELTAARSLSKLEARLLRVLAPVEWTRREE